MGMVTVRMPYDVASTMYDIVREQYNAAEDADDDTKKRTREGLDAFERAFKNVANRVNVKCPECSGVTNVSKRKKRFACKDCGASLVMP